MLKKGLGILAILICFSFSFKIIWKENLQHYIPQTQEREIKNNLLELPFIASDSSVKYLHFFDEACLNSRINIEHIQRVSHDYQTKANFFLINASQLSDFELKKKYNIPGYFKIVNDLGGEIARFCGIKTTPYALVTSPGVGSFYGNYNNSSGLCGASDIIYSGPAVALNFLVNHKKLPLTPAFQTSQIGCKININ